MDFIAVIIQALTEAMKMKAEISIDKLRYVFHQNDLRIQHLREIGNPDDEAVAGIVGNVVSVNGTRKPSARRAR